MFKNTILTVDDDSSFRELVKTSLERVGYQVLMAATTEEAMGLIQTAPVDLILLDVRIPTVGGLEFCRWLRSNSGKPDLPVLMVSVLQSEDDKVRGLDAGADDYLPKPFPNSLLVAHMNAILRRSGRMVTSVTAGDITLNFETMELTVMGQKTSLSRKEFEVLASFAKHPGKLLTRHALCEMVWGAGSPWTEDRVDKYVRLLRLKLGECANYIQTVWGLGYRWAPKNS